MCEVVSITMAALSIASTAAAYSAQASAAKAQANYQSEMYSQTAKAAAANYEQQTAATQRRLQQEAALTAQQGEQNAIAAAQAKGAAATAFGEQGVQGGSVNALLADFDRQEAVNRDTLRANYGWKVEQAGDENRAFQSEAQSRISGATPAPVRMPSALAAGLQMGTAALGAYDTAQFRTRQGAYDPNNTGNSGLYKRLW